MTMAADKQDKVLNVPTLRFPEFQEEWACNHLKEHLSVNKERNKDNRFSKKDVLSVSGEVGIVNQIDLLGRSFAGKEVSDYHIVKKGNVVYTKSPLKEFPYGIIKVNRGTDGIVSTLYAVYDVLDNTDGRFIEYYFANKDRINRYLKPIVRIGAKHDMKIGNEEVLLNTIKIPSYYEQKRVSDFLDIISKRIETQSRIIEKLQSLIIGLEQILLKTQSDWRTCYIGDVLSIGSGKDYKHLSEGNIPVYGTGGYMLSVNDFLYDGDSVCIGRKGTIDKPIYLQGRFWTVDTLFYTHDFRGILPRYCYYLFQTINWQMYNEASGVPSLSKDTIERIMIAIPDIEEQEKTCLVLDSVTQKISLEKSYLSKLQQQKSYLLSTMFI